MMESYEKKAHLIKLRLVITLLILVAKTTGSFNFTHHGHFARAAVTDTSKNSLTQADRDAFLNKHNTLRQQVNPTASNMKKMVNQFIILYQILYKKLLWVLFIHLSVIFNIQWVAKEVFTLQ